MNFLMLSIRRPVAVGMFFLGIVLVGGVAWQRMPVELFPALSGDRLTVNFNRPGSEPEVIEREILLPLQAKTSTLPNVSETWGEIRGTSGRFQVRFESGADIKIRELELQRLATSLQREQPRGTSINVTSSDTSVLSSFVMMIQVVGGDDDDLNTLHDLVEERIAPRFAAVAGISQALVNGGAPRQITVTIDPDRAAALGMTTDAVSQAVRRNVGHLQFVGALENESGRTSVVLDGRPEGLTSLSEARVQFDRPVRLRHVSDVTYGNARETSRFRVNGKPAVGLILFQEQGANLVRLGADLRKRLAVVREELKPLGLDLVIGFDAAKMVEDQISRLAKLGASGFFIALLVLFLFLRQWRAVAVVGIAVPISLLASLSLLFLVGQSFNLITLFGMFVAIGLVVDNSVVVYEAVQRRLEQGADIEKAVREGLRRTVRAIIAASATTAVVFLPMTMVDFSDEQITALVRVVTLSVLLPLGASLVVAVGLVPLLAHRLAAPAAQRKLAEAHQRRVLRGDLLPPDPLVPPGKIRCFITGKLRSDKPEENARQRWARSLVEEYGYPKSDIDVEVTVPMGRERKRVDLAVYKHDAPHKTENVLIFIETKRDDKKLTEDDEEQFMSYMAAAMSCHFGMLVGDERRAYERIEGANERVPDIPRFGSDSPKRPTRSDLVRTHELKSVFRRCHNYIYVNEGFQKAEAFRELLKLIFCKTFDEEESGDELQFSVDPQERRSTAGQRRLMEERITPLFKRVLERYPFIFNADDRIKLEERVVAYIVSELQFVSLLDTETDVKGDAYEELVGANLRGDRGEYFTPRNVCDMAIRMAMDL